MKNLIIAVIICVFSANSFSQVSNCIDFVEDGGQLCDTFYLPAEVLSPVYIGCVNDSPSNPGIYGGGSESFNFNGSNQEITFTGYGFLNQFNQMGYSINGGAIFYLSGSFPATYNGVTVDLTLSQPAPNWQYYTLTFSGDITTIEHEAFESGITTVCSQPIDFGTECLNFGSYGSNYCSSFYVSSLVIPVYNGCVNNWNDGIYPGTGDVNLSFTGNNQEVTIEGYGIDGQFNQMGYSVNGGSTFYLDGSFPMSIGGVTVDLDLTTPNVGTWEYYTITFSGAISSIIHESFESGITQICILDLQSAGIAESGRDSQLLLFPNPTEEFISLEANEKMQKIEIYSMNGNLVRLIYPNSNFEKISVNELSVGSYYVSVYSNTEVTHTKFIKK